MGIGQTPAPVFVRDGPCVIVADRDRAYGDNTVAAIERGGGEAAFGRTDLSTRPFSGPRKPIIL